MKTRLVLVGLLSMGISYSALAHDCGGIAGTYIGNFADQGLPNSNYTLNFFPDGGGSLINEGSIGLNILWSDFNATNGAFGNFSLFWKLNRNSQRRPTYSVTIIGQAAFVPTGGSPLLPTTHSERVILKSKRVVINSDCSIS